jgi:hypothetical protein
MVHKLLTDSGIWMGGPLGGFGGLVVSMLASGTQDREAVRFFGRKNPQHAFPLEGK